MLTEDITGALECLKLLNVEPDLIAAATAYDKARDAFFAAPDGPEEAAAHSVLRRAEDSLHRVAALPPEQRTRSADIYDPLTGLFTPTQVPETLRLAPRERLPGDRVAITLDEFDRLQALEVDTEIASMGPPDPAEHDRVAAALEKGGTIAEGARVFGVSKRRMKLLIVQHRVTWPVKVKPGTAAAVMAGGDMALGAGEDVKP